MGLFNIFKKKPKNEIIFETNINNNQYEKSKSGELLTETTKQKDNGNINKAIEILREAYKEMDNENIIYGINPYLRLPMYLQQVGRNDEGWRELNELLIKMNKTDNREIFPMDSSIIYDKMRLFLQREGKNKLAIKYGIFSYLFWAIGLYR